MVKHFGKQDSAIKTKKELINHEKKSCINALCFLSHADNVTKYLSLR